MHGGRQEPDRSRAGEAARGGHERGAVRFLVGQHGVPQRDAREFAGGDARDQDALRHHAGHARPRDRRAAGARGRLQLRRARAEGAHRADPGRAGHAHRRPNDAGVLRVSAREQPRPRELRRARGRRVRGPVPVHGLGELVRVPHRGRGGRRKRLCAVHVPQRRQAQRRAAHRAGLQQGRRAADAGRVRHARDTRVGRAQRDRLHLALLLLFRGGGGGVPRVPCARGGGGRRRHREGGAAGRVAEHRRHRRI
mmetsp:Transcript_8453/g.35358  ORF Transcript_8453/g.35358 Transcript_8453/m.35358 type:complete len:252 (+) Transcript_8453:199-954(+)